MYFFLVPNVYVHTAIGSTLTQDNTTEIYCSNQEPIPSFLYSSPATFPNIQCRQTFVYASLKTGATPFLKMKRRNTFHMFICKDTTGKYATATIPSSDYIY
jgi:hypothetical protein